MPRKCPVSTSASVLWQPYHCCSRIIVAAIHHMGNPVLLAFCFTPYLAHLLALANIVTEYGL